MVDAADSTSDPKSRSVIAENLPTAHTVGKIEPVAVFDGPMPTGVTVSHDGRIFVNFPRWGDKVPYTVAELQCETVPYPNADFNKPNAERPYESLISVQSVVVDPKNRLWLLDTGRIEFGPPKLGGPKLVGVDLATNQVFKIIVFTPDVAMPTTYLNDMRFDLRRGKEGMAFITDSSSETPGIIVVDLATGQSWRRLTNHESTRPFHSFFPLVEGRPWMVRPPNGKPSLVLVGADGIAIGNDGKRLFYSPLSSWSLYSVSTDALADQSLTEDKVAATVKEEGEKGVASDGLESDSKGNLYVTSFDQGAILRRSPDGSYETLVFDPRVLWPDTLSVAGDGYLYFIVNQLHRQARFNRGKDLREKPYVLYRVKIDAKPVMLK
ncbi:MAG: gluconolaconase [Desulfomonile tiedjei]|nr:gluconolaconase [Desulfomonile tiedjei]